MFIPDVCIQIAGVSKAAEMSSWQSLHFGLSTSFGFPLASASKAK